VYSQPNSFSEGPYYSYATPSDCDWNKVPKCIAEARTLITGHTKSYGGEPQLEINHIVAIAWSKAGRRKVFLLLFPPKEWLVKH
jgi:hypothetical protein